LSLVRGESCMQKTHFTHPISNRSTVLSGEQYPCMFNATLCQDQKIIVIGTKYAPHLGCSLEMFGICIAQPI